MLSFVYVCVCVCVIGQPQQHFVTMLLKDSFVCHKIPFKNTVNHNTFNKGCKNLHLYLCICHFLMGT